MRGWGRDGMVETKRGSGMIWRERLRERLKDKEKEKEQQIENKRY